VGLSYNGWVDPSGNSAPTGTATVSTTGLAVQPNNGVFHLGNPGTIVGTFATAAAGGYTGEADGISWQGALGAISMPNPLTAPTAPSTPSTGYTTGSLFPFAATSPTDYTHNYSAWGGRCSKQAPPSSKNPNLFTVTPGSMGTAQTIQEPLLDLGTINFSGFSPAPTRPAHVVLTFNDGTCTDSWNPTLLSTPNATTGWLKNPGQPYAPTGDLTVCADYNNYKASVTMANNSFTAANVVPALTITRGANAGTC
jgi:hypothetical protein